MMIEDQNSISELGSLEFTGDMEMNGEGNTTQQGIDLRQESKREECFGKNRSRTEGE